MSVPTIQSQLQDCTDDMFETQKKLHREIPPLAYIYPANNVTFMKIAKILPLLCPPKIMTEAHKYIDNKIADNDNIKELYKYIVNKSIKKLKSETDKNIQIQKILDINKALLGKKILETNLTKYTTSGNLVFDIKEIKAVNVNILNDEDKDKYKDLLGDPVSQRYDNTNFSLNTKEGKDNICAAFIALSIYVYTIIFDIRDTLKEYRKYDELDKRPSNYEIVYNTYNTIITNINTWIRKIGLMVYSFKAEDQEAFRQNPLILVHLIKMLCDGIQYGVIGEVKDNILWFQDSVNKLEIECYKFMTYR